MALAMEKSLIFGLGGYVVSTPYRSSQKWVSDNVHPTLLSPHGPNRPDKEVFSLSSYNDRHEQLSLPWPVPITKP